MTNATADDYRWFESDFARLAEAYCITMVRGITPAEVLRLLQAESGDTHARGGLGRRGGGHR